MARLAEGVNIALRNPDTGGIEHFSASSDVPDWATGLITNPDAWEGGAVPDTEPVDTDTDQQVPDADVQEPPRSGQGGSKAAWAKYARSLNVEFPDDATRDDIIASVDAGKGAPQS